MTQPEVELRRDEILEVALALFEHGGIEAVSFRRIAAQLGCSYTAPYRYFASKHELLTALRAQAFRWIERHMAAAIASQGSPIEQLRKLARAYIEAALDQPDRYALMFFDIGEDDREPPAELVEAKRAALDVCTQVVRAAEAAGQLSLRVDALSASHLFWCGAHGLVSLQVGGQFMMGRDIATLTPMMIDTLIAGLADVSR